MSADETVTAVFAVQPAAGAVPTVMPQPAAASAALALTVRLAGNGRGSVTSSPAGIACGAVCSSSWPAGSRVTLIPHPGAASRFVGFAGACAGRAPCTLVIDAARQLTATFVRTRAGNSSATTPLAVSALRVGILGQRPWRRLLMRLRLNRTARISGRLLRGTRAIASAWRWAPRGTRSLVVRIPPGAHAGRYTVELVVRDTAKHIRGFRRTLRLAR